MILHPQVARATIEGYIPAWEAIGRAQQVKSRTYTLFRQPDHAHLAGELVQHVIISGAPPLSDEIAQGLWMHDEGWADFDSGVRKYQATPTTYSSEGVALNLDGKPLSFMEVRPADAVVAWDLSIEGAEWAAPIAGLIVSGHFHRLAKLGLTTNHYAAEDKPLLKSFVEGEEQRHQRLMRLQTRTEAEVCHWIDVLRFCDLLSLYLCSTSAEAVEFPERLGPRQETIRLRRCMDAQEFSPAILDRETEFVVSAYEFPGGEPSNLKLKLR